MNGLFRFSLLLFVFIHLIPPCTTFAQEPRTTTPQPAPAAKKEVLHVDSGAEIAAEMTRAFNNEKWVKAEAAGLKLLVEHPDYVGNDQVYYVLAFSSLYGGNYSRALNYLKDYLERSTDMEKKAKARRFADILHKALPEKDGALKFFLKAEQAMEDGLPVSAHRFFERLIQEYPESPLYPDALNAAAYVLMIHLRKYEEACDVYDRIITEYVGTTYEDNAMYGKAAGLERAGKDEAAKKAYEALKEKHSAFTVPFLNTSFPKLGEAHRLWHRRAELGLKRLNTASDSDPSEVAPRSDFFLLGSGLGNGAFTNVSADSESVSDVLPPFQVVLFTAPDEHLGERLLRMDIKTTASFDRIPLLVVRYFGIDLGPEYVSENKYEYFTYLRDHVVPLLEGVPEPLVILETEANRGGMENWDGFGRILLRAVQIIKKGVPNAKVGISIGDWFRPDPTGIMNLLDEVSLSLDFIGYRILLLHDGSIPDPIDMVMDRVVFSLEFLRKHFQKPLLLTSAAVSSSNGLEKYQHDFYQSLFEHKHVLDELGVYGLILRNYRDDPPEEDTASENFGLVAADGRPKRALKVFTRFKERLAEEKPLPVPADPLTITAPQDEYNAWDFRSGEPLIFTASFSMPTPWNLILRGESTGALRTFHGMSKNVLVEWFGDADRKAFTTETVRAVLRVLPDASKRAAYPYPDSRVRFTIAHPLPVTVLHNVFDDEMHGASLRSGGMTRVVPGLNGLQALRIHWSAGQSNRRKTVRLNDPVSFENGDLGLTFLAVAHKHDYPFLFVGFEAEEGELLFPLAPFRHRRAGPEELRVLITGDDILRAYRLQKQSGYPPDISDFFFLSKKEDTILTVDDLQFVTMPVHVSKF